MDVLSNLKTHHLSLRSSFKRPLGGAKLTNRVEVNLVVVVVVSICCVCGCLVVVGLVVEMGLLVVVGFSWYSLSFYVAMLCNGLFIWALFKLLGCFKRSDLVRETERKREKVEEEEREIE